MADVVLVTLNARYFHAAFGLRYLKANLGVLCDQSKILEFVIKDRPSDIVEAILAEEPKVIGLGVYIWNVEAMTKLASLLKRVVPEIPLVIGGPQVSFEYQDQPILEDADYLIRGEGEVAFSKLCLELVAGRRPTEKIISGGLPDLEKLSLPYELYTDEDIAHRTLYVEASRGCPFGCEFCLSSLDERVRRFVLEDFLNAMDDLYRRGARQFKFVDRTFNLKEDVCTEILEFFLQRLTPELFVHFEIVPDRLPEGLHPLIERFPAGSLQFEAGVQTFSEEVAQRIGRRQNNAKVEQNLGYLRRETHAHLHTDLIVGLPGEDVALLASGFDRLMSLSPHEIQVGILKKLPGAPIVRHDDPWAMVYDAAPPFEVLRTSVIDFATMQRLKRFARYWDIFHNSGRFKESVPLVWSNGGPFDSFLQFSDWLFQRLRRTHAISLSALSEAIYRYLLETGVDAGRVKEAVSADLLRVQPGKALFSFLRTDDYSKAKRKKVGLPSRQARHHQPDEPA
jgi:hypothetical protein